MIEVRGRRIGDDFSIQMCWNMLIHNDTITNSLQPPIIISYTMELCTSYNMFARAEQLEQDTSRVGVL